MKLSEFKLRIISKVNQLIDDYFCSNTINERFINSTLKFIVKQNSNKYDNVLSLFLDENGEIDMYTLVDYYAEVVGDDGIRFDLKQYIDNEYIRNIIPNKILILKKDDILNMVL